MTLQQLILDTILLLNEYPHLRIGQALSNVAETDIDFESNSDCDPFYNDKHIKPFLLQYGKPSAVDLCIKLLKLHKQNLCQP